MAPRPRPISKQSAPTKPPAARTNAPKLGDASPTKGNAMNLMPPPPVPTAPPAILERDVKALETIFTNAITKTAQLYAFHADTRRLGVSRNVPYPPRSLVQSLGEEVEKYDQLCDMIEAQLQHSIAVLRRDIAREEKKIQEKEEAAAAEARLKTPITSPTLNRKSPPPLDVQGSPNPQNILDGASAMVTSPTAASLSPSVTPNVPAATPQTSPPPGSGFLARRHSVITQSSLHRPSTALLPKLDLSATSLRMGTDEFMRGPGSPVTLAPRSARPSGVGDLPVDLPPDLFSALAASTSGPSVAPPPAINIGQDTLDLTLDPPNNSTIDLSLDVPPTGSGSMAGLGNSADKPIELDFEVEMMPDLFGDGPTTTSNAADHSIPLPSVFSAPGSQPTQSKVIPGTSDLLQSMGPTHAATDMMAALGGTSQTLDMGNMDAPITSGNLSIPAHLQAQGGTPSPASLLSAMQQQPNAAASQMPWDFNNFDFTSMQGLSDFGNAGTGGDVNMEDVFGMGTQPDTAPQ